MSTTSASYVLNHSDLDSLLNDNPTNLPEEVKATFGSLQNMDAGARTGSSSGGGLRADQSSGHASSKTSVGSDETLNSDLRNNSSSSVESSSDKILKQVRSKSVGDNNNDEAKAGNESGEPRRKKSSVSQLIARFEKQSSEQRLSPLAHLRTSRSVTPDRGGTSPSTPILLRQRSVTPDQRPASAFATLASSSSAESQVRKLVTKSAENLETCVAAVSQEEVVKKEDQVDKVGSSVSSPPPVGKESASECETPVGGIEEASTEKEKRKEPKEEEREVEVADEDGE